jgi:hypothetical protein
VLAYDRRRQHGTCTRTPRRRTTRRLGVSKDPSASEKAPSTLGGSHMNICGSPHTRHVTSQTDGPCSPADTMSAGSRQCGAVRVRRAVHACRGGRARGQRLAFALLVRGSRLPAHAAIPYCYGGATRKVARCILDNVRPHKQHCRVHRLGIVWRWRRVLTVARHLKPRSRLQAPPSASALLRMVLPGLVLDVAMLLCPLSKSHRNVGRQLGGQYTVLQTAGGRCAVPAGGAAGHGRRHA